MKGLRGQQLLTNGSIPNSLNPAITLDGRFRIRHLEGDKAGLVELRAMVELKL